MGETILNSLIESMDKYMDYSDELKEGVPSYLTIEGQKISTFEYARSSLEDFILNSDNAEGKEALKDSILLALVEEALYYKISGYELEVNSDEKIEFTDIAHYRILKIISELPEISIDALRNAVSVKFLGYDACLSPLIKEKVFKEDRDKIKKTVETEEVMKELNSSYNIKYGMNYRESRAM